jgi:hypothetical protein
LNRPNTDICNIGHLDLYDAFCTSVGISAGWLGHILLIGFCAILEGRNCYCGCDIATQSSVLRKRWRPCNITSKAQVTSLKREWKECKSQWKGCSVGKTVLLNSSESNAIFATGHYLSALNTEAMPDCTETKPTFPQSDSVCLRPLKFLVSTRIECTQTHFFSRSGLFLPSAGFHISYKLWFNKIGAW